jgi:hypothetical protein
MKMRYITTCLLSLLLTLNACVNANEDQPTKNNVETKTESIKEEMKTPTKLLRHVVLFNFNEAATEDKVQEIERAFAALPSKIPAIHSFEWGLNNSPEGLDKGMTHCFFVTFLSEEDRAIYLPHPDHQEFVKLIGPYVEDVTVVDYWTT